MDEHNNEHSGSHQQHHSEPHTAHNPEHKTSASGGMQFPKIDFKGVTPESFGKGFGDFAEIVKLNKTKIEEVAHRDQEGIGLALLYIVLGAAAVPIGLMAIGINVPLLGAIRMPIVDGLIAIVTGSIFSALLVFGMHMVAEKMFKGQGKFEQFFRVMGYASLINVVGLVTPVPFLGALGGLWLLAMSYMILTIVHKLDQTNAILTILVTAVGFGVIGFILFKLGLGQYLLVGGMSSISLTY